MNQNKVHKCSDRIVNIYQPQVRPMVRGKDRANIEFGAKINISEVEGFVRCNHIGWKQLRPIFLSVATRYLSLDSNRRLIAA